MENTSKYQFLDILSDLHVIQSLSKVIIEISELQGEPKPTNAQLWQLFATMNMAQTALEQYMKQIAKMTNEGKKAEQEADDDC